MAGARRPRVAFVCGNLADDHDGVADYILRLTETLALRTEIDPVLVTSGPVGGQPARAPILALGRGWGAGGLLAVSAALRRLRPDLVHLQFAPSAFGFSPAVGLLPPLTGGHTPWVTTLHEYGWWSWPSWVPSAFWRPWERRGWWDRETLTMAPRSRALVVTNDEHAAAVRARSGREPEVVPLAPNVSPGDSAAAGDRARARLRLAPGAKLIVFFGFVHPVKGVRYLIEALGRIRDEHPDCHLVVVGGFTSLALPAGEAAAFRRELDGHARAVGVADRVTFTGHLPAREVSDLLNAAVTAVLPFTAGVTMKSGALAAVLSHGVPAVVTAADPPDPALIDGRTAVVVHGVRDARPLAAGLRRMLTDPVLRATVAAGGRTLVAEQTWPAVAAAHTRLYRRILGPAGAG